MVLSATFLQWHLEPFCFHPSKHTNTGDLHLASIVTLMGTVTVIVFSL